MVKSRFFFWISAVAIVGCTVNGYFRNPFSHYTLIWEHPINVDTENVQEIEVPFVKHGNTFSLCFDKLGELSNPGGIIQRSDYELENDKIEASFSIADTVIFFRDEYLYFLDYHCPINGQELFLFDLPEHIDREQKGVFRIKFKQVDYLKDAPNVRVVLSYTRGAF